MKCASCNRVLDNNYDFIWRFDVTLLDSLKCKIWDGVWTVDIKG